MDSGLHMLRFIPVILLFVLIVFLLTIQQYEFAVQP